MVIDPSSGFNKGVGNAGGAPSKTAKAASAAPPTGDTGGKGNKPADSVQLSAQAHGMARVEAAMKDTSEVREDAVATVKAAIDNGTYSVNSRSIAEKMLADDSDF